MCVTILLHGIAPVHLTGGDEQGYHEIGLGIDGGRELIAQKIDHLLQVGFPFLVVLQQIGADELQGSEAHALVGIVDIDVIVGGQALEAQAICLGHLFGMRMTETVTEEVEDLLFVIGDGVIAEHPPTFLILKEDVAHMHIGEVDALRSSEDVHANGHTELSALDGNLLDDAMPPLPRLELQRDPVARGEVVEWLVDIELEVLVLYGCHELSHLGIGNGDHLLVGITVVVQSQTRVGVPFGLDDGLNSPCRCLYEHEVMQVVTQRVLIVLRTIVLVGGILLLRTLWGMYDRDALKGYEKAERRQRLLAFCQELSIAIFLQHGLDGLRTEVAHHVPRTILFEMALGNGVFLICIMLYHSYYFSLSLHYYIQDVSCCSTYYSYPMVSLTLAEPRVACAGHRPTADLPVFLACVLHAKCSH